MNLTVVTWEKLIFEKPMLQVARVKGQEAGEENSPGAVETVRRSVKHRAAYRGVESRAAGVRLQRVVDRPKRGIECDDFLL